MTRPRLRWTLAGLMLGGTLACTGTNPDLALSSGAKTTDAEVIGGADLGGGGSSTGGTPTGGAAPGGSTGGTGGAPTGGAANGSTGGSTGGDPQGGGVPPPADAGPEPEDAGPACVEGATEPEDCGLNGRGRTERTCRGGEWTEFGACGDPDVCVDDAAEMQACGLRDRGTAERVCVHGQWSDFGPCDDPDRTCEDGARETARCGLNGRGEQAHTCVDGHFGPFEACVDPDVCVDDAEDTRPCGQNGRGSQRRTCDRGQWADFGRCDDPDDCVDGTVQTEACGRAGLRSRTCIQGRFGNFGPCMEAPALCDAPIELAVGQTPGSLGDTNAFVSSCNDTDRGEAIARFRAPAAGVYAFRIGQHANDFSIALRNACDPAAAEVSCAVNAARTMAMLQGQEVFIIVEGTANRPDFTLEVQANAAADSACNLPQVASIGAVNGRTAGDSTLGAQCGQATGPEAVYIFVPLAAGLYTFRTPDTAFDTMISLRHNCLDANAEFACHDDVGGNDRTSLLSARLGVGELVYVIVDGWGGDDAGDFTLRITGPDTLVDPAPMVQIAAGPFYRGATSDNQPAAERPVRRISLRAYEIDRHEVTVAQYRACVDTGRCPVPSDGEGCNWGLPDHAAHPINCLSWSEGHNYCTQMGKRLPTEAEWEKAARGGCETHGTADCVADDDALSYPWGAAPAPDCDHAWMLTCDEGRTAPVPATDPAGNSVYGVQDLAGNVSELTFDCFDEAFYADGPDTDPVASTPHCERRTARGGSSTDDNWRDVRAARRIEIGLNDRESGLRCAR
jgi:formylglycine-generating enzyme required for sulfatase activity